MQPDEPEEREYIVTARVKLSGATMVVMASSEAEARAKAEEEPDYDFAGAEMTDWTVTDIRPA
ncbi:hypothetical protein EN866_34155 [Mesorhizobium sp. M2D.F.Ca.ET.223.01.1.1]|uniref:hypothetical protein n=1 Tax=Mesorhizobium sp. M2D.F.Ca.ET.223.01.1.1 TaxID=2563940 RepID=UPI001092F463|nr:hypothetical protein [Mesorhizobium sp. M2D.F.Ca.ET.223.01.1.1]TGR83556.1 hypothetical protein EN866_34155 [Mesorhizobium sp. M2D.F.Ca.ET.223.01.1.1]TGT64285.1 hypothetical protein EN802_33000 [bacterium M00.F.Ca.ET.159.01.1.1]TGT79215.1 hypothetical protein EN800_32345 [bacterium M00.F.Ca.ET.157.01.1.1]